MIDINSILTQVKEHSAPDIHIKVDHPPIVRLPNGDVHIPENSQKLTLEDVQTVINAVAPANKVQDFETQYEVDFSYTLDPETRFRVNLYREKNGPSLAFRLIPNALPDASTLNIPESVLNLSKLPRGLILVTGPTGSGKSTTLSLLIDKINSERKCHIITVEDPIEFMHNSKQSVVTQRELGAHTKSFKDAIKSSLRQDPDVVMIGEMRDLETIMAALTLAETGHLVLSTLHTQDAPQTMNRIIDAFPDFQKDQVATQLSLSLKAVVSQTLLPRVDSGGRVGAYEVLLANDGVSNCIKEGKTHQLYSMMQIGKNEGMQLLDDALINLVQSGAISKETALSKARDIEMMRGQLGNE